MIQGRPVPRVDAVFYQDADGACPFIEWTDSLDDAVVEKLVATVESLELNGTELRRPTADLLRNGIYELRLRHYKVQYRVLYFFHGRVAVVLSHGIVKLGRVPDKEIEKAIENRRHFEADPNRHTYREPEDAN